MVKIGTRESKLAVFQAKKVQQKLSDVGIKEHQLNDMALLVSANKSISIGNFKKLDYNDVLNIYKTML